MRLDMDCVRDILLCVEENTSLTKVCVFTDPRPPCSDIFSESEVPEYRASLIDKYGADSTFYHVRYCAQSGLILVGGSKETTSLIVYDLSPAGHELINNIRKVESWDKVKSVGSYIGAFGLNIVKSISEGVATAAINSYLGLK